MPVRFFLRLSTPGFGRLRRLARRRGLIVIGLAPALEVDLALTRLQAQLGRLSGFEPLCAARNLCRNVQLGFIRLGDIGSRSACEQTCTVARLEPSCTVN